MKAILWVFAGSSAIVLAWVLICRLRLIYLRHTCLVCRKFEFAKHDDAHLCQECFEETEANPMYFASHF